MNTEEKNKIELFHKGLEAFQKHNFYDAHEYWEDLWSDYRLEDAKFIQGLIQLSVGYFHISNLFLHSFILCIGPGSVNIFSICEKFCPLFLSVQRDLHLC